MAEIIDFPFASSSLQAKQQVSLKADVKDSFFSGFLHSSEERSIPVVPSSLRHLLGLAKPVCSFSASSICLVTPVSAALKKSWPSPSPARPRPSSVSASSPSSKPPPPKLPLPHPDSAFERQTRELAEAVLARDRERNWNLLNNPRRLRIQTIDSLCMEIAGTLPLLSGSAARRPVDDASELHREAARNTLRQLGNTKTPEAQALHEALHTVLLHRDANLADVQNLLAEMLQTREQWAELVPLDRASLSEEALDEQVRPRLERTLGTHRLLRP